MAERLKHIQEVDTLKGWAIFLVVLGHAIIVYPIDLHANVYCDALFSFVSSFHVKLFFLVSGFCFSFRGNYGQYIKKKVFRLLIPYYVFCVLEMIAKLVFSGQINRPRGMGEFMTRMLFYGGDYWFLWTLFMIFLIFPAIHLLLRRGTAWEIGCLIGLLIIAVCRPHIELLEIESVLRYLFWFACGAVLRNHWRFDPYSGKKAFYAAAAVLLVVLQIALAWNHPFSYTIRDLLCGAVGIALSIALTRFTWFNNAFSRFGEYSLQLYLMNGLLLGVSRIVVCNILGVTIPAVIIAFNMLVDFFLSYLLIKYVFSRFRFMRVLMGMV